MAERGYANFNLGEVGQRAGVAKQTVYNIFGTKERIIATAVNEYFEEREQLIHYASRPATMERMIERQIIAGRASKSMPHYLAALMTIYFSVDTDPDVWAAIHKVATYPHRGWIEALVEAGQLEPWIEPAGLIDELAAHSNLALLDWCRGRITTEQSLGRKVMGSLIIMVGSTSGPARQAIEARLNEIVRNGLPSYPESVEALAQDEASRPPVV